MRLVYICTPLAASKFDLAKISQTILNEGVFAFIPPTGQLNAKQMGVALDRRMIDLCDELWAFGPIGRDCAWEVGYAQGLGKPTKIFIDKSNQYVKLEDWMTPNGSELVEDEK